MSCLFQSLGTLCGQDPTQLRLRICDYLETNPKLMEGADAAAVIEWESNQTMPDYVRHMRSTSTWGGATEIAAFVNMMGKAVVVVDLRSNKKITFLPKSRRRLPREIETLIISWNGYHYEPIRKEIRILQ